MYIKFKDSNVKYYDAEVIPISNNIVRVKNAPFDISGFGMFLDNDMEIGSYWDYKYDFGDKESTEYDNKYTNLEVR